MEHNLVTWLDKRFDPIGPISLWGVFFIANWRQRAQPTMGGAILNQVNLGAIRKLAESEQEPSMVSPFVSN